MPEKHGVAPGQWRLQKLVPVKVKVKFSFFLLDFLSAPRSHQARSCRGASARAAPPSRATLALRAPVCSAELGLSRPRSGAFPGPLPHAPPATTPGGPGPHSVLVSSPAYLLPASSNGDAGHLWAGAFHRLCLSRGLKRRLAHQMGRKKERRQGRRENTQSIQTDGHGGGHVIDRDERDTGR